MKSTHYRVLIGTWIAVLLAACAGTPRTAVVNGIVLARPTLHVTGQPFSVTHHRAYPLPVGASGGLVADGGWISGQVCMRSIFYYVDHAGDHVTLRSPEPRVAPSLAVRELNGFSIVSGDGILVTFGPEQILGTIDGSPIHLQRQGDSWAGTARGGPTLINGRAAMFALPPADQAAILANLLSCHTRAMTGVSPPLVVGFGGAPTALPDLDR